MHTEPPPWDESYASTLVGLHILVGLTHVDPDGNVIEQRQLHGTIVVAEARRGIGIALADTEALYWLPPDLRAVQPARPGRYRLRSTGEVVTNPDLLSVWTVQAGGS